MDGSSLSSLSEEESSVKQHSLPTDTNEQKTSLSGHVEDLVKGERLLSGEEQVTLITESMSVTSADEEKLQLLNKNMELRRLNKELMKLNEDWDHIYHNTSEGLQQRVTVLEQETSALKQLNNRLLLKVDHEQIINKRCPVLYGSNTSLWNNRRSVNIAAHADIPLTRNIRCCSFPNHIPSLLARLHLQGSNLH